MKAIKFIMSRIEIVTYAKDIVGHIFKDVVRIPYILSVVVFSLVYWCASLIRNFYIKYTKIAIIIGFVLCFFVMFIEYVYFKIQMEEYSYRVSELLKENYELEQTDRYDIGYHDAMAKKEEMLTK